MTEADFKLIAEDGSFEAATIYFKNRVPLTPKEFYKLADKYRGLAFTVGGYTKAATINRFYDALVSAVENGTTMAAFRSELNEYLKTNGEATLDFLQADNIFRTNIQTAYQVGHYNAMTNPEVMKLRPYWQYDAVNDGHTRPSHLAMDGKVFPADSPVWDTWYPPNGFRCRCGVSSLSEGEVKRRGLNVEEKVEPVGLGGNRTLHIAPDPRFGVNPAKVQFKPDLKGYPDSLKKAFTQRKKAADTKTP